MVHRATSRAECDAYHDVMDLGLNNRVYIVTGASGGLGFASASALNADGAYVVLASRSQERLDAARQQLPHPDRAVAVAADLADAQTAQRLVDRARSEYGRLDGAVISVGGPAAGSNHDVTEEQWRDAFESVFLGGLRMARTVLEHPIEDGDQIAVTLVLSSSVKSPIPGLAISNGLRPGLAMAAKTLADECGPRGGRVNVLLPGRIDTDRVRHLDSLADDPAAQKASAEAGIPLRRYGRPEEFGQVAAFITSPAAAYVSGVALAVDGGATRAL